MLLHNQPCLYMVVVVILVTGQQQNHRGLCAVVFQEQAKGVLKLQLEKPSKIPARGESPVRNDHPGIAPDTGDTPDVTCYCSRRPRGASLMSGNLWRV